MKSLALIPFAVALTVVLWSAFEPASSVRRTTDLVDRDAVTSYIVDGVQRQFSVEGVQTHVLAITAATRWQHMSETEMSDIKYRAEGNNGEKWDIRAAKGIFHEDRGELALSNGVTIDELQHGIKMTTDAMRLLTDSRRALGDNAVTIVASNNRTDGSAFELDLNNSTAKLLGNVKTVYE